MKKEVDALLSLKAEYKALTGEDLAGGGRKDKKDKKKEKENKKPEKKQDTKVANDDSANKDIKKQTRFVSLEIDTIKKSVMYSQIVI